MSYDVRGDILGFPSTRNIDIVEIDPLFSTMKDLDDENISFTLVNPHLLREYSIEIPNAIKVLLDITNDSNLSVYNILVIQKPLEKSTINFLAPIIINNDNNKLAQTVIDPKKHSEFGMAETIESFRK